jgi:hypothetical protein
MGDGDADAETFEIDVVERPSLGNSSWRFPKSWDLRQVSKAESVVRDIERSFQDYRLEDGLLVTENTERGYYHSRKGQDT